MSRHPALLPALVLLLLSGCGSTTPNRVLFGTGPAAIEVENQGLQSDCEIVRGDATHTPGGGIALGTVLLRCRADQDLPLEYRVTWWDEHDHQLSLDRAWKRLKAPARKETVVTVQPPHVHKARARRGTFELRYHSPTE